MEGLIWYVHFIIRKRKVGGGGGGGLFLKVGGGGGGGGGGGDVLLKFVELSCGIGFLLICERRTPLASLRMLLKNIFSQALMGIRRTPLASLRMYVFLSFYSNVHITFSYLVVFFKF